MGSMGSRQLRVRTETLARRSPVKSLRNPRGSIDVIIAEIAEEAGGSRLIGRGEATPYPPYGERAEEVGELVASMAGAITADLTRRDLLDALPPGAARNALDLALWDLEAKRSGTPVWRLAGLQAPPGPVVCARTLPIDVPERMAAAAAELGPVPVIRIKCSGEHDDVRLRAVRLAAPEATLIVDAEESWSRDYMDAMLPALLETAVALVEQPMAAGHEDLMIGWQHAVPLAADDSVREVADLDRLSDVYRFITLKLNKLGGLTAALAVKQAALKRGLQVIVGGIPASSLGLAPGFLLAGGAAYHDLDAPLWLDADRAGGIRFEGAFAHPPSLWGMG